MKILIIPDIADWAIDRLVQATIKYNPQHEFKVLYIPPRDVETDGNKQKFIDTVKDFKPDLIEFDYFRTAGQLLDDKDINLLIRPIPTVLVHHNQRDKAIKMYDFKKLGIDKIVHHNQKGFELYQDAFNNIDDLVQISLATNLDEFEYSDEEPEEQAVGLVGRIVRWKRPFEIIKATKDLGFKNLIMGLVNDGVYFNEIQEIGTDHIKWDFWECKSEERKDAYKNMTIYVGYSDDSRETGTLGLLEAMSSGVPVITTPCGIAAEIIEDGVNGLVVDFDDYSALKAKIKLLMEDKELRQKLRKNAWNTVKNITEEKMALEFNQLWHEVAFPDQPLVSVIIPATYDRAEQVNDIIIALDESNYGNIEAVVCWDEKDITPIECNNHRITVKHIFTQREGYNLAMARNLGVIEASGEVLMFCDSRLKPDKDSVLMFQQAIEHAHEVTMGGSKKVWFFGDKGSGKRDFVENFSAVKREFFIEFGMCNERITEYGGMSQEIRSRWKKQDNEFTFLPTARAVEIKTSKMTNDRRKSIKRMKLLLYKLYGGQRI